MANQLVKINGRNIYDDLGQSTSFNCNFETLSVSGRGLAPTRDRQLQFPGDVGARDYGSLPDVRRITINGILHADTIQAFEYGLDQLKQLCRNRLKVDEILYGEVEAQTLWFADESVVAGPFGYGTSGVSGAGNPYITNQIGPPTQSARYQVADLEVIDYKIEFLSSSGVGDYRGFLFDHDLGSSHASSRIFYISPAPTSTNFPGAGGANPAVGDQWWIRDDRYYLVNYSGTMNEERLTSQWFAHGFSNISLPFKAVYPFAVSDVKTTDFTPNATNGYFKSINTGTAPTFPVYRIKGAANTPTIVEATHSLVWNANDNNATNILGESVSATVSAAGFYGQTGKLNQAIAFDANMGADGDRQGDNATVTNTGTRTALGIGAALNLNQGTISFWFKRPNNWNTNNTEYIFRNGTSNGVTLRYYGPSDKLDFITNATYTSTGSTVSATLTPGNWYLAVARWDTRRAGFSVANGSAYATLDIYPSTSATAVLSATTSSNPADASSVASTLGLAYSPDAANYGWDGLMDDLAIWDRPLTDTEVSTLVNSGTGVRADTVASSELVYYSDFDQTVGTTFNNEQIASSNMDTAQVSVTTTTAATVAGYGDKIFPGTDRFVLYDETGYKVQSTVATSADTSITYATLTDADKVGVYATLNGTSEYFALGDVLDAGTNDVIISAWLNVNSGSSGTNGIVGKRSTSGSLEGYELTIYDGVLRAHVIDSGGSSTHNGATDLRDGKWHHVMWSADRNGDSLLWVDGVADGTPLAISGLTGSLDNTNDVRIGVGRGAYDYYNGAIKDVRIWIAADLGITSTRDTAALSLATNPNGATVSINSVAQSGWWLMSDAAAATTLADSSASSNTLALVGGTTTNYGTHSRTQLAYISKNLIADGGMENGGIGGRVQGDAASSYSTITSQVKKDAQSIQITNGDATPASFRNIFTTASGEDYVIRAWHRGAATVTYNNMMTVGATAIINTTQAGVTANTWGFVESCYEAAGASTDLSIISSSTTDTETCQYDDMKLLPNLVNNGGMEGGANPPTGWSQEASATVTSDTDEHSGTYSAKIVTTGAHQGAYQVRSATIGDWYEFSAWYKADAGSTPHVLLYDGTGWINITLVGSTSWQRVSKVFRCTGTIQMYLRAVGPVATVYFDDVALVHRPDLSVSFNNMTNGYRFEPTRLTRGYKTGANEQFKFASAGAKPVNPDEFSVRAVIRPQFPSTTGEDQYLCHFYNSNANQFYLKYAFGVDKFQFSKAVEYTWKSSYSPVMSFSQDEEIEVAFSFDTTNGMMVYINGSNVGATNNADTTANTQTAFDIFFGRNNTHAVGGNFIIDDLEILAKSQPAEWFAEQHAKRNAAKFENLKAVYSSTLDAGDILTLDSNTTKVIARAKLWDASASTDTDALTNMTINQSKMPILSPTKAMLYFPNSIPSGVEIFYRNNFQ